MFNDISQNLKKNQQSTKHANHELEPGGRYRIDKYDEISAFSSFLPGIGGPDGVPLWCMYINRAQAVVSFGVANKDNAIAEFLPATWAYQLIGVQGFRTFCKVDNGYYEPFQKDLASTHYNYHRSMWIEPDRVQLREANQSLGLIFDVEYFSPVNQPVGSLVRLLTITNTSDESKRLNALDGLALILPSGFTDIGIKAMRRINEAYAAVKLICNAVPFFSAKVQVHDEAEVVKLKHGNFYAAWVCHEGKLIPLEPFVDPDIVFGGSNDLITPRQFITKDYLDREAQVWENRLPCALVPFQAVLEPGKSITIIAMAGFSPTEKLLADFLTNFTHLKDFEKSSSESRQLIDSITSPAFTVSRLPILDAYARQNYLDNVLRGGIPLLLPSKSGPTPLYIYCRRHGDIERDYNYFDLPPYPLSSGPGSYRDICQNRRYDIWFYPDLWDQEIRMFVRLIRADGYNPLTVECYCWVLPHGINPLQFCPTQDRDARVEFCSILQRKFHPGEILNWANLHGVDIDDRSKWLNNILEHCDCKLLADRHDGGYWIDHWTYITDLLEAFAGIFPDRVEQILTEPADIGWVNEGIYVVPRSDKYVLKPTGPMQLNAVVDVPISDTPLPPVTVFGKLSTLLAVKAVSFDYGCKGIEMEAGRPGWNDSLNGLPALFGSSTAETAEVSRMARWLQRNIPEPPETEFPVEVADFIDEVGRDLQNEQYSWNRAATIRENYRARIRENISGKTRTISGSRLKRLLAGVDARATAAMKRSIDPHTALIHTYYCGEPVEAKTHENSETSLGVGSNINLPQIKIEKFIQRPLPLFFEGQVHWLRLLNDPDSARRVYQAVRNSPLFDSSLKMYKLNECLDSCQAEIGRARTFTRGWYENESVWLHMSYKYLLELLRCDLTQEFFEDAKTMLVPFMDPAVYGRSILENSSFIASSVCPDPAARGKGFVARLSGSTAEFIHIWLLLTVGQRPFYLKDNKLHFRLSPLLPGQWFTKERKAVMWRGRRVEIPESSFACALLGQMLLVYHNKSRADTFGRSSVKPVRYLFDNETEIEDSYVGQEIANRLRRREYDRVDVWLE